MGYFKKEPGFTRVPGIKIIVLCLAYETICDKSNSWFFVSIPNVIVLRGIIELGRIMLTKGKYRYIIKHMLHNEVIK